MTGWTWELLAGPEATITEGPAWDGTGLFYSAIDKSEIRRYDPDANAIQVVHRETMEANGLYLGPDGALYACSHGCEVHRYDAAGNRTVLASHFEGKRLNSPNDCVLDSAGRLWFTDPRYGNDEGRELDHCSVYRLTPQPDGSTPWQIERLTFDTTRPNGLLLSPDERTLYVAQSDYLPGSIRQLRAYPVQDDGTLGTYTLLHDFGDARGIDGLCWAADGTIVATCGWDQSGPGPRIAVFAPDGTVLEEHPTPGSSPTNCLFGGPGLNDLYVTTIRGHLYRVRNTGKTGLLQPPPIAPWYGAA
ncbi:MAG TPA: SMP-30/gluconolactonase/LRE family protein [Thermomicrobiales bacterium]|nr:SMP-30/gluconolactonase/LRE family protein [Thermomicrobiales bacterium]